MKVLFCPGSDFFQKTLIDVALLMPDVTSRFLGNTWSDGYNVRECGFEYSFMPFIFSTNKIQDIPALHEFTVRGFSRNRMPPLIRRSFGTFEDFLESEVADFQPDLIVCGATEYAGSYILNKIAKENNIICVGLQTSFIANHLIFHSQGDAWIEHFRCQDVSNVKDDGYISSIKLVSKNLRRDNRSERFRFLMQWWLRISERALRVVLKRPSFDDYYYLLNVIKSKINHRAWLPDVDTLQSDKTNFVLVALNQPSIPSSWDIPTWLELIDFSLKATPENIQMVIRPHPNEPSLKEPEWLNEALRSRNVLISRPGVGPDLESLIHECRTVITMNSAVGMEALLAGKPVFTLAPAFYARSGMARAVSLDDYEYVRGMIEDAEEYIPQHSTICKFTSWLINDFIVSLSCATNSNSLVNRIRTILNELKECK